MVRYRITTVRYVYCLVTPLLPLDVGFHHLGWFGGHGGSNSSPVLNTNNLNNTVPYHKRVIWSISYVAGIRGSRVTHKLLHFIHTFYLDMVPKNNHNFCSTVHLPYAGYVVSSIFPTACWSSPARVTEKQYNTKVRYADSITSYFVLYSCSVPDPDPNRTRIQERKNYPRKKLRISFFEVLDVLFWGLNASPETWMSFKEA